MKKNSYKTKLSVISGIALLLVIGLCIGYWMCFEVQSERIAAIEADRQFTYDQMMEYESELIQTYKTINEYKAKLDAANATISDLKTEEYELVYLGNFKISYYCNEPYKHICGYGKRTTASGKPTEVGWTAAADWEVLPNGSVIYIEGIGFREIMDVGGAVKGNHIDVLVDKHQEALNLGNDHEGVWALVKKGS
jgi:3D (Asp-Asp-Asp) domain-containing protein